MIASVDGNDPGCLHDPDDMESSCESEKSFWPFQLTASASTTALKQDAEAHTAVLISDGAGSGLRRRLNRAQCTITKDPNLRYDADQAATAIQRAGAGCQANSCSEPHEDVIKAYTSNCLYGGLNSALRQGSGESFEKFETYAEYLATALINRKGAQPSSDNILWRGQCYEPQVPIYPVGSVYMLKGFTSSSTCEGVAIGFASCSGNTGPVFRITTKNPTAAKPVYQVSRYPHEREYLFPACTCFRMDGHEQKSGRTYYNVTEVDC